MTKEILILNGSPRINGNTAVLSEQLASGARDSGAVAEIVYLHGLDIQPCDACDSCQLTGKGCVIGDDMEDIYSKLRSSDSIVVATPVYWFSMTAQMKLCMDRWYALESESELKGKRLALLMVYGDSDLYTSGGITVIRTLEGSCRYVGMDFNGIVHGSAMDIGDAEKNPILMEQAFQLGKSLAQTD